MVNVFNIFKGQRNKDGKVKRIRKLGYVHYDEESEFCEIKIQGHGDSNYILEVEENILKGHDYNIFYEDLKKKDLEKVGVGYLLHDLNVGLIRLEWDFYDNSDVYIDLSPLSPVWASMAKSTIDPTNYETMVEIA